MSNFEEAVNRAINKASQILVLEFRAELRRQGHENTGKLRDSIHYEINDIVLGVMSEFFMLDYGVAMDTGIPASRIPFTRGSGSGSSKYIDGLIKYFLSKGKGIKTAKRAAFATAMDHKRYGMPTKGSYRFSKNGKRTGFIQIAYDNVKDQIEKIMTEDLVNEVEYNFDLFFKNLIIR